MAEYVHRGHAVRQHDDDEYSVLIQTEDGEEVFLRLEEVAADTLCTDLARALTREDDAPAPGEQ